MKVMLVCNAGMSTGILAKKIEEASDGKLECKAYGEAEYLDHIKEGYELLLIGPQIRHLKKQIEESVSIPVDTIAPQYYGMMNGKGVFKEIEKKYKDCKRRRYLYDGKFHNFSRRKVNANCY